jgi:hypothetical protein
MTAKFWGQYEIREGYQAIFWYIIIINDVSNELDHSLNSFLHSDSFRDFCLPFNVKKSAGENYHFLQRAFNQDTLSISDFKVFSKEQLISFFKDYSTSDSWGDDKNEFVTMMNSYRELLQKEASDHFFLISKEWFDKGNKILNADSEIYIYYFLIIWFDEVKKVINVCEWIYE